MISYIKGLIPEVQEDANLENSTSARTRLRDYLINAFLLQVRNGSGRCAVFGFFEAIVDIVQYIDRGKEHRALPKLEVRHVSSSTIGDSFDVKQAPSVRTRSRSAENLTSPPSAKRLKTTDQPDKITKGNSYCDLVVVAPDHNHHDHGKYLFVIEVHSHGKGLYSCLKKLSEEMVSVLQCQREIFGLLFGTTSAILLKGCRLHMTDNIVITQKCYDFVSGKHFDVRAFQELTMAVFCCLVYGTIGIEHDLH